VELKGSMGKQDQYAAAYGGLNYIRFNPDDTVEVKPLAMPKEKYLSLQENLVMFYTGDARSAGFILSEQIKNLAKKDKQDALNEMCAITNCMRDNLCAGNISTFGRMLHENWLLKKTLADGITNGQIEELYALALKNGAEGGKLLGAGGGGFLLFYCEKNRQKKLKEKIPLRAYDFKFENAGSQIFYR
jgi:D-glycero-alpha-D-manno-heptose-7-phosphate kinase